MADEKTRPFQMRVSPEWLATLDDWRRKQPDLPARAEAIRRLVEQGLSASSSGRTDKSLREKVIGRMRAEIGKPSTTGD